MNAPSDLQQSLGELLGDARLKACTLPDTDLQLWLIDGDNMAREFSQEETQRILHEPPYWSFCWASGLAVARYLAEFPEWVRLPALAGAALLCAPVNWPDGPRPLGERPAEMVRVQANAAVNRMFIAACDRSGEERGVNWVGGSTIVDADGYPLAGKNRHTGEQLLLADLPLAEAWHKSISEHNHVHLDRRPSLY